MKSKQCGFYDTTTFDCIKKFAIVFWILYRPNVGLNFQHTTDANYV